MAKNFEKIQQTWDQFLTEWPLKSLKEMSLEKYSSAGQDGTFTAWIEQRLDQLGSIWGGSSFKFGIYSRDDKTPKENVKPRSYSQDYGWYSKYGTTPEAAFHKVRNLVFQVAKAANEGKFKEIESIDLGRAYKWKIAFHYQDQSNPGVVAVFKKDRLQAWLKAKGESVSGNISDLHLRILKHRDGKNLVAFSDEIWAETAKVEPDLPVDPEDEDLIDSDADAIELPDGVLNAVLYGPPGTGKTFSTTELAVRLCDGAAPLDNKNIVDRGKLMSRYRELRNLKRINFVTFHPSFSYEEFVEGIRPEMDGEQVRYRVKPGVFREAVSRARGLMELKSAPGIKVKDRKFYKMSLGDTSKAEEDWIFQDCIDLSYVCLGFAAGIDFSGCNNLKEVRSRFFNKQDAKEVSDYPAVAIHYLKNELKPGDLVVISDGNTKFRAIAMIAGDYTFVPREAGYEHRRTVEWLWKSEVSLPVDMIFSKRLSQMSIYLMDQKALKRDAIQELLSPTTQGGKTPNCVLIIDEINRANLAKTFGELITLLEPSKRLGGNDEQAAILPYSGENFTIPKNLYVIGTMNTADRSIALMDTALRRRFTFLEMPPQPDLLRKDVGGINLQELLKVMNDRIETLFDRDHILGHTYFLDIKTINDLVARFRTQIIPLLQEYFYEDWRRIQQVFNDQNKPADQQIIQTLDPTSGTKNGKGTRFRVNPTISPSAIKLIYQ